MADRNIPSNLVSRLRDLSNRLRDSGRYAADECDLAAASLIDEAIAALPAETTCSDPGWEMRNGSLTCKGCGKTASDVFALSEESDPCVSHLAMKEYEKALMAIRDYPLGAPGLKDSQIWADMLETAREALDGPASPEKAEARNCLAMTDEFGTQVCTLSEGHGGPHVWSGIPAVKTPADPHDDLPVEQS